MFVTRIYQKVLCIYYKRVFDVKAPNTIRVTGVVHFSNRRNIEMGNNVLLKRSCDLLASPGAMSGHITIGNDSEIHENCVLRTSGGDLKIGARSSLGRLGIILAGGGVAIGNAVRIGPRVNIITNNHVFKDRSRLIVDQGSSCEPVTIDDDVWVGANVTITPGVHIHRGAVIAAGAVVTKDVNEFTVVGGVPAEKLAER